MTWNAGTVSRSSAGYLVRPRAALVLQRPYLVAVDVFRKLEQAAERLGLPKVPAVVAPLR